MTPFNQALSLASRLFLALTLVSWSLPGGGCVPPIECDSSIGVCPRPEPGIRKDSPLLTKSLWFADERIGLPYNHYPTLCAVERDGIPGRELVIRGQNGIALLLAEEGVPAEPRLIAQTNPWEGQWLDTNGDKRGELFVASFRDSSIRLWGNDGGLIWKHAFAGTPYEMYWTWADVENDGLLEFAVGASDTGTIEILNSGGNRLSSLPNDTWATFHWADIEGDGVLEMVTQDAVGQIGTWRIDGSKVASFRGRRDFAITRLPDDDSRDYILVGCDVFDENGVRVGEYPVVNRYRDCEPPLISYQTPELSHDCVENRMYAPPPVSVRFDAAQPRFRVKFEYSYRVQYPFVAGFPTVTTMRAIMSIYHDNGELEYQEVLNSSAGPGSFLRIPSDIEGEDMLLVAENARILAYRFRR